jgi:hypothetical protein
MDALHNQAECPPRADCRATRQTRPMAEPTELPEIERRLADLRAAHRALDERISQLIDAGYRNQLELQRLKKQKLALRDRIARLESDRLPDIIA